MSRTNEVAILEVETIQLITRRLCIHHIFINHERGALGVVGDALADLTVTRRSAWGGCNEGDREIRTG